MSRTGINYHDVANAAVKILGLNENPTVDRIREVLGTGSKSTIARHLKDWKAHNGPVANTKDLPPDLVTIVTGLWEHIQSNAEETIQVAQEDSNQKIKGVETHLKEAQQKAGELQKQIHQLESTLFQQVEANKNLNQQFVETQILSSKQSGHISSLEEQVVCQKNENSNLHVLLKNIQNNVEHYQASMQQLQQEQVLAVEKQRNRFEHEISLLRKHLSEAINTENRIRFENEKLQEQLTLLEPLKVHSQLLEKTLIEKEAFLTSLDEKNKEVVMGNLELTKAIELKSNAVIESEQKAMVAYCRVQDLEKALCQANDKISMLRHEHLFIMQEKSNLEGQLKQLKINIVKESSSSMLT